MQNSLYCSGLLFSPFLQKQSACLLACLNFETISIRSLAGAKSMMMMPYEEPQQRARSRKRQWQWHPNNNNNQEQQQKMQSTPALFLGFRRKRPPPWNHHHHHQEKNHSNGLNERWKPRPRYCYSQNTPHPQNQQQNQHHNHRPQHQRMYQDQDMFAVSAAAAEIQNSGPQTTQHAPSSGSYSFSAAFDGSSWSHYRYPVAPAQTTAALQQQRTDPRSRAPPHFSRPKMEENSVAAASDAHGGLPAWIFQARRCPSEAAPSSCGDGEVSDADDDGGDSMDLDSQCGLHLRPWHQCHEAHASLRLYRFMALEALSGSFTHLHI